MGVPVNAGDARGARALKLRVLATGAALGRAAAAIRRAESTRARTDTRAWAMQRRERTRHLIELGGLVQKAGLVDLTDDDRATILGGLLELADRLQSEGGEALREVFRRRGRRAFEADATAAE